MLQHFRISALEAPQPPNTPVQITDKAVRTNSRLFHWNKRTRDVDFWSQGKCRGGSFTALPSVPFHKLLMTTAHSSVFFSQRATQFQQCCLHSDPEMARAFGAIEVYARHTTVEHPKKKHLSYPHQATMV